MSPRTRPGAPNAARGVVLVVVAGIIGLVLLSRGGTSSLLGSSGPVAKHATTTMVATVPSIAPAATTTIPQTTTPPAQVSVAIFNGTGGAVTGAAGNNKAKLTPLGYTKVSIFDTSSTPKSAVYYAEGAKGDATAIAQTLGFGAGAVAPASGAANIPSQGQGKSVVVIIGKDAASATK